MGWTTARFLAALVERELAERGRRRTERHLREVRLLPGKTAASFDFNAVPMISKAQVNALAAGYAWLSSGEGRRTVTGCAGRLRRSCRARAAEAQPVRTVHRRWRRRRAYPDRKDHRDLPGNDHDGARKEPDGPGLDGDGRGRGGTGRTREPRSRLALQRPWRNPHAAGCGPGGVARREPGAAAARSGAVESAAEGPRRPAVAALRLPRQRRRDLPCKGFAVSDPDALAPPRALARGGKSVAPKSTARPGSCEPRCFSSIRPSCVSTKTTMGMASFRSRTVASSSRTISSPASPTVATTARSGSASLRPMASGTAQPIVQSAEDCRRPCGR